MVDRILSSNRCASNCLRADSETGGAKASMLSLECSTLFISSQNLMDALIISSGTEIAITQTIRFELP